LAPTAAEPEIGAAIGRLIEEPHFRAAARRLGDIITTDVSETRLVNEMEHIVRTPAS
jgi:hypothetical protein